MGILSMAAPEILPTYRVELVANLSGRVRCLHLDGRSYLMAPMVLIVPGVLNGSAGPIFYPPEENARSTADWNGLPLTLWHPTNMDGSFISASSPVMPDARRLGLVRSANNSTKLRAEGWFDEERVRRADDLLPSSQKVLPRLKNGQPIELSTGLYLDMERAPAEAAFNGRAYAFIARNYRPDHVAVLPDRQGACSIRDGCGILVNAGVVTNMSKRKRRRADVVTPPKNATAIYVVPPEPAANAGQPSEGLDITPEKACQILKDGTVHGKPLTEAQRGMFGALCGKRRKGAKNEAPTVVEFEGRPVTVVLNAKDAKGHGSDKRGSAAKPEDLQAGHIISAKDSGGNLVKGKVVSVHRGNVPGTDLKNDHIVLAQKNEVTGATEHQVHYLHKLKDLRVHNESPAVNANGMSYSEVMQAVGKEFREQHPVQYDQDTGEPNHCYLTDVYDDFLVYQEDGDLYRQSYEQDEDGDVTLGDDIQQVKRVITYEPVTEEPTENEAAEWLTEHWRDPPDAGAPLAGWLADWWTANTPAN